MAMHEANASATGTESDTHKTRERDRYLVRRVGHTATPGTVTEVAIGYVWFAFDGDEHATPYSPHVWAAMVVDGRAMFLGSRR